MRSGEVGGWSAGAAARVAVRPADIVLGTARPGPASADVRPDIALGCSAPVPRPHARLSCRISRGRISGPIPLIVDVAFPPVISGPTGDPAIAFRPVHPARNVDEDPLVTGPRSVSWVNPAVRAIAISRRRPDRSRGRFGIGGRSRLRGLGLGVGLGGSAFGASASASPSALAARPSRRLRLGLGRARLGGLRLRGLGLRLCLRGVRLRFGLGASASSASASASAALAAALVTFGGLRVGGFRGVGFRSLGLVGLRDRGLRLGRFRLAAGASVASDSSASLPPAAFSDAATCSRTCANAAASVLSMPPSGSWTASESE